jgi:Domain of unknown function (DUF932)
MSKRTNEQLQNETRVGFVADLGNPWWGTGHFDGCVPIEDARKLLTVNVQSGTVRVEMEDPTPIIHMIRNATTVEDAQRYADVLLGMREDAPDGERFQAVVDADYGYVFQIASQRWDNDGHQYERMLDHAAALIDASGEDLMIGSVIALDHRQKAMVQVRPPEGVTIGGDRMLPWLALYSSLDSSWSSGIKGCTTRAVCDNTAEMVMAERTATYKRKHTKGSSFDLGECRRVVDVWHSATASEIEEIERLMNTAVPAGTFERVADILLPVDGNDDKGKPLTQTAITRRTNVRDDVRSLYHLDPRVAPYKGTAWGVVQAWSTHSIHGVTPKGQRTATERQTFNLISGEQAKQDGDVRRALSLALAN